MFEEIAKELQQITKTKISGSNCENRWKVLERNYKKYIENSKLTGRGRKMFEYAEVMNSILGRKKNIHPVLLLSSDTINAPSTSSATDVEDAIDIENINAAQMKNQEQTETVESTVLKRKAVNVTKFPTENKRLKSNILREIRNDRKEYYRKRLDLEEKKLSEKVKKNDFLEQCTVLLEKFVKKYTNLPETDL